MLLADRKVGHFAHFWELSLYIFLTDPCSNLLNLNVINKDSNNIMKQVASHRVIRVNLTQS